MSNLTAKEAFSNDAKVRAASVQIEAYRAKIKEHSHAADAFGYAAAAFAQGGRGPIRPAPPAPPPGCSHEMYMAHCAIHDLVTPEEFEALRDSHGFVQIDQHWAQVGKASYCCVEPQAISQFGRTDAKFYTTKVKINSDWMAKVEAAQPDVRRTTWEKMKAWLKNPAR